MWQNLKDGVHVMIVHEHGFDERELCFRQRHLRGCTRRAAQASSRERAAKLTHIARRLAQKAGVRYFEGR